MKMFSAASRWGMFSERWGMTVVLLVLCSRLPARDGEVEVEGHDRALGAALQEVGALHRDRGLRASAAREVDALAPGAELREPAVRREAREGLVVLDDGLLDL